MRIISGTARGTNLYTLEGLETMPTLDRVKESLFNIISEQIYNSNVLDLFSGSGAIGLEFASRGANKVILCDNSKRATEIIKKNIEKTHLEKKVELHKKDFLQLLDELKNMEFDIIYLDPPYKTYFINEAISRILSLKLIKEDGLIIAETDDEERIEQSIKNLKIDITDRRKYGRAYLFFLKVRKT